jgi:hypothetical protein
MGVGKNEGTGAGSGFLKRELPQSGYAFFFSGLHRGGFSIGLRGRILIRVFTRCRNDDRLTFPEELKIGGCQTARSCGLKSVGVPVGRRPSDLTLAPSCLSSSIFLFRLRQRRRDANADQPDSGFGSKIPTSRPCGLASSLYICRSTSSGIASR